MRTMTWSLFITVALLGCNEGQIDSAGADSGPEDIDGGKCEDCQPTSCRLVDVMISVDASDSMTDELQTIRDDVFPGFAARLATIGEGLDNFRVGTIDACPSPATLHTQRSDGSSCEFSSGHSWIDSSSPNLNAEFACVGDIYEGDINPATGGCTGDNDDEQPASAVAAALEGDHNSGFSRSDALLLVIAITDEDEQPTPSQSPQQVFDRLVAVKDGDPRRIVFVGIGGSSDCPGVQRRATDLQALTDLFIAHNRGVWKDLCLGDLDQGLDEAFAIIEQACDELPPPVL
jgi:hypothetical protein